MADGMDQNLPNLVSTKQKNMEYQIQNTHT